MSALYREYLEDADFGSYEDFLRNYRIKTPENFNFAYDVLDRIAKEEPEKRALVLEALKRANREDLIGFGKECLIRPEARKQRSTRGGQEWKPKRKAEKHGRSRH